MNEQWPTDPAFRTFAAKIADAVTHAINVRGAKFSTSGFSALGMRSPYCECPIGSFFHRGGLNFSFPDPCNMAFGLEKFALGTSHERRAFMFGFDGYTALKISPRLHPYYRLGVAYNKRLLHPKH